MSRLRTNPFFESTPLALPLCRTIMEEVAAVAKAKGLTIPEGTVDRLLKQCTDVGGLGLPSSMMVDNFEGRPMETEVSSHSQAGASTSECHALELCTEELGKKSGVILIPGHPWYSGQRGSTSRRACAYAHDAVRPCQGFGLWKCPPRRQGRRQVVVQDMNTYGPCIGLSLCHRKIHSTCSLPSPLWS